MTSKNKGVFQNIDESIFELVNENLRKLYEECSSILLSPQSYTLDSDITHLKEIDLSLIRQLLAVVANEAIPYRYKLSSLLEMLTTLQFIEPVNLLKQDCKEHIQEEIKRKTKELQSIQDGLNDLSS